MNCTCAQYAPLELARPSIRQRLEATPAIVKPLVLLAKSEAAGLRLLQCPQCAQHWQTGREWNLGNGEYAY